MIGCFGECGGVEVDTQAIRGHGAPFPISWITGGFWCDARRNGIDSRSNARPTLSKTPGCLSERRTPVWQRAGKKAPPQGAQWPKFGQASPVPALTQAPKVGE